MPVPLQLPLQHSLSWTQAVSIGVQAQVPLEQVRLQQSLPWEQVLPVPLQQRPLVQAPTQHCSLVEQLKKPEIHETQVPPGESKQIPLQH